MLDRSQILQTIKNRLVPTTPSPLNTADWEMFKKYTSGNRENLHRLSPLLLSNKDDFLNRWEAIKSTYEVIKPIDSIEEISSALNELKIFLEIAASRKSPPRTTVTFPDGSTGTWMSAKEPWIDAYFEDFLSVVKHSLTDLESLQSLTPKASASTLPNKLQKFLDEIATIEKKIGPNGAVINPRMYAPVRTLWASISEKDIRETRGIYCEWVKDQVDFAKNQVLNTFIRAYKTDVRKQPDKQASILLEHRDGYVNRLAETYAPIQNWFYSFWNEETQTVSSIEGLELEVFHFCHESNKPFEVGRTLLHKLYGDCLAIEYFNKMLQSTSKLEKSSPEEVIKKGKPQYIKDIWLGEEEFFWQIVKTYANKYIDEVDGRIIWAKQNSGVSYLAGFTYVCQQKGWIAKNSYSAPDFKRVYQNTFNIEFDEKPFKPNNLTSLDSIYLDPFKGISHKVK
ncbi:hypothetical protein [Spirosoma jeollabukense]